jgi:hypothetical protein
MSSGESIVIYKDIPDFPGYRIGNDGSVWSAWVRAVGSGTRHQYVIGAIWRLLQPKPQKSGHIRVKLTGRRMFLVHRLVLELFVGPCPPGMECCHNDGNPGNNRVDNLRWGTRQSNADDRIVHGTNRHGEQHYAARLTAADVIRMRADHARGAARICDLAARHRIAAAHVSAVIYRKKWKHV